MSSLLISKRVGLVPLRGSARFTAIRGVSTLPVNIGNVKESQAASVRQHLTPVKDAELKMNAPETFAIDVDTSRAPGVSTGRYYLNLGKSLVKLYKAGIVNVWKNYWKVKELQQTYSFKSTLDLTRHILDHSFAQNIEKEQTPVVPSPHHISRADYQRVLRTDMDFKKLPLFAVIFAVFFELTPLLVLMFPRLTPTTCSLPYQTAKDFKRANKDIETLKEVHEVTDGSSSVHQLHNLELQSLAKVIFHGQMIPVAIYPRKYLESKVQRHIDSIRADNILIGRFGSVWAMDYKELVSSCLFRAIPTEGRSENQMRADLLLWMINFSEGNGDAGFFFTPVDTTEDDAKKVSLSER